MLLREHEEEDEDKQGALGFASLVCSSAAMLAQFCPVGSRKLLLLLLEKMEEWRGSWRGSDLRYASGVATMAME